MLSQRPPDALLELRAVQLRVGVVQQQLKGIALPPGEHAVHRELPRQTVEVQQRYQLRPRRNAFLFRCGAP